MCSLGIFIQAVLTMQPDQKTKLPSFKFYPADFIVGTSLFSAEQVGAYIRLLCYQWDIGALPDDNAELIRLSGCSPAAFGAVRAKFDRCLDGLLRQHRLDSIRSKGVLVKRRAPSNPLADPEWLETLRGQQAYAGLDIDRELGKMKAWCEANKRTPSRKRFVNWLNRTERPMMAYTPRAKAAPILEPAGWRDFARSEYADPVFLDPTSPRYAREWQDLDRETQGLISSAMASNQQGSK